MTASSTPELVVVNGDIRTMDGLFPRVEALAVTDGRVSALGTSDDIRALAGKATRILDCGGRMVLPGFQDTHIHLQDSGTGRASSVELDHIRSVDELIATIAAFAKANPDRPWVLGEGWYSGIFGEHNLDRHVLDKAVPDRPCLIVASDGHNGAINSKAIAAIGLTRDTPDPMNGHFVKDGRGEPSGLLYETTIRWVEDRMPPRTDADYMAGVRYGQALCNRHGITGVLDALVEERHMRVYNRLDRAGELTVRVAATGLVKPEESVDQALQNLERLRRDFATPMVRMHSAKFFLDGVLENRTGAMIAPYSDEKGGNAPLMFGENHLRELFIAVDRARFQIHVHVIGDKATQAAFDCLEAAYDTNGGWPSLHQLAHVQCIDPADIPRFRKLGVVANVQPLWARHEPSVTDVALPMVGEARGRWMYAFRSMIDAGAPYTLSSDWGVSTLNPFPIMQTAVTRQPERKGRDHPVFLPEERITIEEAVRGYTTYAAAAAWRAEDTGSLARGKFADLMVIDRDIFTVDPHDIAATEVQVTLLGGREVYRASGFSR
ncbi:MAG: amidohydrolase [Hyphomicrobiaceae bacterium]